MNLIVVNEPDVRRKCYDLRFEILRKPWNQPKGSETDEDEESSILLAAIERDQVLATVRLQYNTGSEAQLRYMAVCGKCQGKGIGKKLEDFACSIAKRDGRNKMFLQAREGAVPFYLSCGYRIVEKSYLLFGEIQHFLMEKDLGREG